jgi:uncharacterized protein YbcI
MYRLNLNKLVNKTNEVIERTSTMEESRKKATYFTRGRKMGFIILMYFMINTFSESCQTALNKFFKDTETHISQQAFSKARNKFDHTPFLKIFRMTAEELYTGEYEFNTFMGYRVSAIDGSTMNLPNSKNVQELLKEFGGIGPKADSPAARGSIQLDILNDMIMDAIIGPLSTDERTMAKEHIETLIKTTKQEKEIILFDRGYASNELIEQLIEAKICFVMRIKRKFNVKIDRAPMGKSEIIYEAGKKQVKLKVVKFILSSNEIEMLLTNIPEELTIEEYKKLYFLRWPVETKYDIVKNKLEIECFSGYTANGIRQDFYTTMYLANVISVAVSEANEIVDEERNHKGNKNGHKVNVNQAIGSFKDEFINACIQKSPKKRSKMIEEIIKKMARSVIAIRPGRSVKRPVVARKSKFHHNHKSNT